MSGKPSEPQLTFTPNSNPKQMINTTERGVYSELIIADLLKPTLGEYRTFTRVIDDVDMGEYEELFIVFEQPKIILFRSWKDYIAIDAELNVCHRGSFTLELKTGKKYRGHVKTELPSLLLELSKGYDTDVTRELTECRG